MTITRSGIGKMKFFIFLLISVLIQTAICDVRNLSRVKRDEGVSKDKSEEVVLIANDVKKPVVDTSNNRTHGDITSKTGSVSTDNNVVVVNKTTHITDTEVDNDDHTTFNTGALIRGFLVFVGLSILVMAYIVFRSFRLSKTRAQMVRKYGVLTHRQDVEMRPLPLDEEDDEDTTVFDASNVLPNNAQHQIT